MTDAGFLPFWWKAGMAGGRRNEADSVWQGIARIGSRDRFPDFLDFGDWGGERWQRLSKRTHFVGRSGAWQIRVILDFLVDREGGMATDDKTNPFLCARACPASGGGTDLSSFWDFRGTGPGSNLFNCIWAVR